MSTIRAAILVLCLAPGAAWAQSAPIAGETLEYDISWRIFDAGSAKMTLTHETVGGKPVWRARVEAHSIGFVSRLFQVNDVFRSTFQNGTLCSEELVKTIHEGRRHREVRIAFESQRRTAAVKETDLTRNTLIRQEENSIPPCAFDVISALFFARVRKLEIGKTFQVPLNDGGRTIPVSVEVQGREEVKTPTGTFPTIRLEPQVFGGTLFRRSGRMFLWLSEDPGHRLVQLKVRLWFGTITAVLRKVSY